MPDSIFNRGSRVERDPASVTTVEWGDVKRKYLEIARGETPENYRGLEVARYRITNRDRYAARWIGCTPAEMAEWVRNGYEPPSQFAPEFSSERKSRRLRFSEDGELDMPLAWSGHDYPYLEWEQRERKPGLKVSFEYVFSAAVDSKVIGEYGQWVAEMLAGLEGQGYDLDVNIEWDTGGLFRGDRSEVNRVLVRVKREGEATDFREWSALLSPGGFRTLLFVATAVAAEQEGKKVTPSLGACQPSGWDVEWTPETRELRIRCSQGGGGGFPRESMDEKVKAAISG